MREKKNTRKQIEGFLYSIIVMRKKNIVVVFYGSTSFKFFNISIFKNPLI
jgi:hypothetical protein